jgi:Nitrile hydratase, alpha chain
MKTSRHELESRIIARAWKDREFRERLLSDPKGVLENESGQKIAPDLKVLALKENADVLYLVLPRKPHAVLGLSESQLESLAAGEGPMPFEQDGEKP